MKKPSSLRWLRPVGRLLRWSSLASARLAGSPVFVGLLLALYGLATHFVTAQRHTAPLRISGWLDVKSQIGNVFYAAGRNAFEIFPHLAQAQFGAAITNATNLAGIRSEVYLQLIHAGATNRAETFVRIAPFLLVILVGLRALTTLHRARPPRRRRSLASPRRPRDVRDLPDRLLNYVACTAFASAGFAVLLLNAVAYYQDVSGFTRYFGYAGSALSTVLDYASVTGVAVFKELIWHGSFLLTDGKEKTLGLLTHSEPLQSISHYLARFPAEKLADALNTATYQALCAGLLWACAHTLQRRRATRFAGRYEALPPHMKRYLARPRRVPHRSRRRARLPAR